jgi:hypothetical protein
VSPRLKKPTRSWLREKHGLDLEQLLQWLATSPFFPPRRALLLREGVAAWFSGDSVKTVHVLIPQLEAALRDFLSALGGVVNKQGRAGGFHVITMGDILGSEQFKAKIPSDIRFHLRVLFTDNRGPNVRNDFAHGMGAPELFGLGIANWVVHAIILVRLIRVQRIEPSAAMDAATP